MKIAEILKTARKILAEKSETPSLDAELILEFVAEKPREFFFANSEKILPAEICEKFFVEIEKRAAGKPVAQILKKKEFCGFQFSIDENVLTPRPETEILVEKVLQFCEKFDGGNLVEIGAG